MTWGREGEGGSLYKRYNLDGRGLQESADLGGGNTFHGVLREGGGGGGGG